MQKGEFLRGNREFGVVQGGKYRLPAPASPTPPTLRSGQLTIAPAEQNHLANFARVACSKPCPNCVASRRSSIRNGGGITVSAPLSVGLIPAYADGRGAVMSIAERVTVSLHDAAPADLYDTASKAITQTIAQLKQPIGRAYSLACACTSPLPLGVGLKTSSAFVAAITVAAAIAAGQKIDAARAVQFAISTQVALGLTQAGSADDTWGAVLGGLVVADAASRRLILRQETPPVRIIIMVPNVSKPWAHSINRVAALRPFAKCVNKLMARLVEGDLWGASTDAAFLHSHILDYPEAPLWVALRAGASGVCLSGKGPAVAAFATAEREVEIANAWNNHFPDARIVRTEPTMVGIQIHEPSKRGR